MRGVNASGFARRRGWAPPAQTIVFSANGQSLSTGIGGGPLVNGTQPFSNVMMFDSAGSGGWTNPNSGTLSTVPLTALQRPYGGASFYPANISGVTPEIAMANTVTYLALKMGYRSFRVAASCVGMLGQPMSAINKGGTIYAYAAAQFELQAFRRLLGTSIRLDCMPFTHGEADADAFTPNYGSLLLTLAQNYNQDAQSLIGAKQAAIIAPIICSQQTSQPPSFFGPNLTAAAMLAQWQANPNYVLLTGPKWQFPYLSDFTHLNTYVLPSGATTNSYTVLGEKYGEVYFIAKILGYTWNPLYMRSISRVGTTLTITFAMPPSLRGRASWPLVFDQTVLAPHGVGTPFSMWGPGQGLEPFDCPLTVTNATNASPIVVSFSSNLPAGLTSGMQYALNGVGGNTAANSVWTITTGGALAANQMSLNGSSGNGAYTSGGQGFAPIQVLSASISSFRPDQVTLVLGRSPLAGSALGIGENSDQPYNASNSTGGFGKRSCSLRDSNLFIGPYSGAPQYNWACEQTLAFS